MHGDVVSSTLVPGVSPPWYLLYVVLLCALGVVLALLRDRCAGRRREMKPVYIPMVAALTIYSANASAMGS